MPDKEYEVQQAKIHEVSLVPAGANGEEFAMFKSKEEEEDDDVIKAIHTPEWESTDDREWNQPNLEDFDSDDLSEISNHFIASTSGFPPENYTDLKLPVVEPDGTLNENAVNNAAARVSQTEGIDTERAKTIIDNLQQEFDNEMDKENSTEESEQTKSDEGGSNEPVEFEDVEEFIEEKELEDEQRDELLNKLGVELEEKEEDEQESEIEKSDLPEEIQQQLEKAEEYEEMKEQREFDEMKKQVEEDFDFLPGETDENAEILKSVKDRVDEEDFDSLVSKLNALSEQIDLEKTFEEAGTQDTVPQGDAFEQATQLAEEKMEKGNYDNIATARKEVWDENPELLEEYQKQRRQQKST